MTNAHKVICLESQLNQSSSVITLGVRPNLSDYNKEEASLIINTKKVYVLEANMKYGKAGFKKAGIDYNWLMEAMIRNGEI